MRDPIEHFKQVFEKLDKDLQEVADISKKYGFGTVAWQNAMLDRIKRKLRAGETLTGTDEIFLETQAIHNAKVMDELKAMGYKNGINPN